MWACFSRTPAVVEDEGGRVLREAKSAGRSRRRKPTAQDAHQDALRPSTVSRPASHRQHLFDAYPRPTSGQQRLCTDDRPQAASVSATSSWQGSSVLSEYGAESRDSCSLDQSAWPFANVCSEAAWPYDRRQPGSGGGYPTHFCGDATGRKPLLNHPYYRVEKRDLARGSCASVALTVDMRTGRRVAVKFIPRASCSNPSGLVLRELQNHKACHGHPHIVELVEVFPTRTDLAVVMEFASGGDMSQLIEDTLRATGRPVPESECRRLFQQLTVAVDYCHRLGIANRDIKLDNLLLQPSRDGGPPVLKMCDFGLSKDEEKQSISQSSCGTPEYVAPEILRCGLGECYSGKAADVWACGVSLYILIAGAFPFLRLEEERCNDIERMQLMFPRILAGDFQPLPSSVSLECADLIGRMLMPDPAKRITVRQILRHPWVAAGMPPHLARLNATLISGVGAVPCGERDDGSDGSDQFADEDACSFSAMSASTVGGHSRTSSGGAIQLQMSLGGGLRNGSNDSAALQGTGVMLRLLGGRPGHQQQQQQQQHNHHSVPSTMSGDYMAAAAAASVTPSSSVSRVSGGSTLSRLSGGSAAVTFQHQYQQMQQLQQFGGLPRHNSGSSRRANTSSGQSMQQIVALLEQMAADDRAAEERPWRSMDLPAAARPPIPANQRRGGAGNPSLDLGRTPVRSASPSNLHPIRQPVASSPLQSPDTLPLSSVLPGRLLPPVRSSFAMAPPRRS